MTSYGMIRKSESTLEFGTGWNLKLKNGIILFIGRDINQWEIKWIIWNGNLETNLTNTSSNNKREFRKIIRHFVKSNASPTSIPPLVTQENGHCQIHITNYEKAECLFFFYFTSILTVPSDTPDLPLFQLKTNATLDTFEISEQEV